MYIVYKNEIININTNKVCKYSFVYTSKNELDRSQCIFASVCECMFVIFVPVGAIAFVYFFFSSIFFNIGMH